MDIYDYPSATSSRRPRARASWSFSSTSKATSPARRLRDRARSVAARTGRAALLHVPADQGKEQRSQPAEGRGRGRRRAAETRLSETFVRWNRPHKLTANLDACVRRPGGGKLGWLRRSGSTSTSRTVRPCYTPSSVRDGLIVPIAETYSPRAVPNTVDLGSTVVQVGPHKLDLGLTATTCSGRGCSTGSIRSRGGHVGRGVLCPGGVL